MKSKILVVTANYYKDISYDLISAVKFFLKGKAKIKFIEVPGVFEIPVVISKNIKKFDGFIALGCVIKGETPHFNYISEASINAIMNLSIKFNKPIGNGILTCLNIKQAKIRSNPKGNKSKGKEAAKATIEVLKKI